MLLFSVPFVKASNTSLGHQRTKAGMSDWERASGSSVPAASYIQTTLPIFFEPILSSDATIMNMKLIDEASAELQE